MSEEVILLELGDITKAAGVDAIVNAANSSLLGGGGVDGAIHRAAGLELLAECIKLHGCRTGEAKITSAGRLPYQHIIHTVGPFWRGGGHGEEKFLVSAYENSLKLAVEYHIRTLAFPSISTGAYRYPLEQAASVAVHTVQKFLQEHPGQLDYVKFVLFDEKTKMVYERVLSGI